MPSSASKLQLLVLMVQVQLLFRCCSLQLLLLGVAPEEHASPARELLLMVWAVPMFRWCLL